MAFEMLPAIAGQDPTKLIAINQMLEGLSVPPVNALDTGGNSLHADAEAILDRQLARVLQQGWWFNTLATKQYSPDGSGLITLSGVLGFTGNTSSDLLTIRNGQLYNFTDGTNVFTTDVTLNKVILSLNIEDLPPEASDYAIKSAIHSFVKYKKQDLTEDNRYARDELLALQMLNQEETRQSSFNMLETDEFQQIRGGRR